jgi:hypothetical protein
MSPGLLLATTLTFSLAALPEATPRFELGVEPMEASLTPPDGKYRSSTVYATTADVTAFFGPRLGVRLLGGFSWYSKVGDLSSTETGMSSQVLLPSWWTMAAAVWRFHPFPAEWLWLDTQAGLGVTEVKWALSDAAIASTGAQAEGTVGVALQARMERHFALRLEARASVFGWPGASVAGCSEQDLRTLDTAATTPVSSGCQVTGLTSLPGGTSNIAQALSDLHGRNATFSGAINLGFGFVFY